MKLNDEKNDYFYQDMNYNEKTITYKMFNYNAYYSYKN